MNNKHRAILKLLAVIAFVGLGTWLGQFARSSETVQTLAFDYGYAALFLIAVISGVNLIVPFPAVTLLPLFIESGLHFELSVVIIALGVTLGDVVAYYLGHASRALIRNPRVLKIMRYDAKLREKWVWLPWILLFVFAGFVPLPNEVLVIPMAFLGYRLRHIFPVVLLGNFFFNFLSALGIIHIIYPLA